MTDLCRLIFWTLVDLMRARATLEAEIWVLRQQINVLRRAAPRRQPFGIFDRLIFVGLYRLFPEACDALAIVKPDTIIRWHRAGFRAYWRWKSRRRGGRPTVPTDIRKLIHEMSSAYGEEPTHEWKRHDTLKDALLVAEAARKAKD